MEVLEVADVLEFAEELLEAEDLTAAPRLKDCSLAVLVVPAAARAGLTMSLRVNRDGLGAVLGGVFLAPSRPCGLGRQVVLVVD